MKNVKRLVLAAVFAALACVATLIITFTLPGGGYFNLGDCIVITAGCLLGPVYGAAAAGIGTALADLLSGFPAYAPATLLIKAAMAEVAWFLFSKLKKRIPKAGLLAAVVASVSAEVIMIAGYFVFECFLYGMEIAVIDIAGNALQGGAGIITGSLLVWLFTQNKTLHSFFYEQDR